MVFGSLYVTAAPITESKAMSSRGMEQFESINAPNTRVARIEATLLNIPPCIPLAVDLKQRCM